ncbi:Polyhomeotic-like protein 2, partial [Trichinella pseudospiralis]
LFRWVMEQNNFNAENASQKESPSKEIVHLVNLSNAMNNASPSDNNNKDNSIVSSVMNSKGEALISEKSDEPVFNCANVTDDATLPVEMRSLTTIHSCKTVEKTTNEISIEKALPGSLKPTAVKNLNIRRRSLDEFFTTTQLRQFETMMGSREEPALRMSKAVEYNNNDGKQLMNNSSLRKSPSLSEKAQNCPTIVASLNAASPTTVWKLNSVPSIKRRKLPITGNKLAVPVVSQAQGTSKRTLSESPPSKGIVINSSNFNFIHPKITQGSIFPQSIPTNRASTVFVNQCGTYSILGLVPSTGSSNSSHKTSDNQVALLSPRKNFRVSDLSSKLPIAPRPAQFISPANNSSGFGLSGAVRATSHVTHPVFSSLCRSPIPGSNSSVFYPANLVLRSGQVISFKQPLRATHPNLHPANRRLPLNRPVVSRVNPESGYVTSSIVLASVSSNTQENQSSIAKAVTESECSKKKESSPTTSGNSHDLLIKNYVPLKPKDALRPYSDAQQNDSNRAASFLTSRDDRLWQIIDSVIKRNTLTVSELNTAGGKNVLRNGSGDTFSYHEFLSNPQMVADQFFHNKGHDAEIVEEDNSLSEIKHVVYGYDILELYQYPKGYPEVSPYPQFLLDEVAKWRKYAKFHNRLVPVLPLNDTSVKVEVENEEMEKNEYVGKDLQNKYIKGKRRKEEVDIKEKVENIKKMKVDESDEADNIYMMRHLTVKTSTAAVCDANKSNSDAARVACKKETQMQSSSSSTNGEQFIESDPRKWTCEQVKAYVQTIFKEGEIDTSVFVNQAIDGIAFLLLNKDHLGELLALRLGPTVKLLAAIDKLRHFQH